MLTYTSLCSLFPGGVNSPARAFVGLDIPPLVVERAQGSELIDDCGTSLVDFCCSWGATILGHSPPEVVEAVIGQVRKGTTFGFTSLLEGRLAQRLVKHMPSLERLRLVSTGTEATMTATRLARAYSGRELVVKFEGNYHGHSDAFLVQAGSGVAWLGRASSKGVSPGVIQTTCSLPYNDCDSVRDLFLKRGSEIAAVIVEPIAANMGVVRGTEEFLKLLRTLTQEHGALLIFDEVVTGFRVGLGGAQGLMGIWPDLTCLGKIIGGGFPIAACGGRADVVDQMAPIGPVYQAGTLTGNAVGVSAAIATIEALEQEGFYDELKRKTDLLCKPIESLIASRRLDACLQRVGSMWTLFLGRRSVANMDQSKGTSLPHFRTLFGKLYAAHFLIPPSPYEAAFVSRAHTDEQLTEAAAQVCGILETF